MDKLPEEILIDILERVLGAELSAVALVSRQFTRLATPLIYQRLVNKQDDPDDFLTCQSKLIRTLIHRPELASNVHHLTFSGWYTHKTLRGPTSDLVSVLKTAALKFQGSMLYPELAMQVEEPTSDAVAALVLSHLPNLRTLRLGMVAFDEHTEETVEHLYHGKTLTMRVIEAAISPAFSGGNPLLANLTEMTIHGGADKGCQWDAKILSHFLRLPSLLKLSASNATEWHGRDKILGWACETRTSNVKILELWDAVVELDAFAKTLRSCKALEVLRWHSKCIGSFSDTHLRPVVRDELAAHAASLRYLSLHSYRLTEIEEGDFAIYTVLEHLELGAGLAHGWLESESFELPLLPERLQHLWIAVPGQPSTLVEKVASTFLKSPALQTLEMRNPTTWSTILGHWDNVRENYQELMERIEGAWPTNASYICFRRVRGDRGMIR